MSEIRARSVAKALTWRVLATLTTFAIVLTVSGEYGYSSERGRN